MADRYVRLTKAQLEILIDVTRYVVDVPCLEWLEAHPTREVDTARRALVALERAQRDA